MNKKILRNFATIIIVAAVASGVTYSFFSDPAKVIGNNFTTGSADLKIKMPNDGCPDWSDSCAGKTWTALYPGWNDSFEVYLKNESPANIPLEVVPFIEETGSSQELWNKSYMEITWGDGSHSTGRYSMTDWKTNSAIKLAPTLAQGQEAGPWVVKFDIDPAAGNEIANAHIGFNVVFDGVQQGGAGGGGGQDAVCGNGTVEGAETCDDGNTASGDGCSATCQSEGCTPSSEVCDGIDNDCDGMTDEGNPGGGAACDGPDTDLCAEGTTTCISASLVCNDTTGSTVDMCNGSDDDCDAASADGSEDPQNGVLCDGEDSDFCTEGTKSCVGGSMTCNDSTGSNVEFCFDGADNDCDGLTDQNCFACQAGLTNCSGDCVSTITDTNNCGGCGNVCGVANGTPLCNASMCQVNSCNAGFGNCDYSPFNGCEANLNTSIMNCGACGSYCALSNSTASCVAGLCQISSCNMGFADCDGSRINGCEINISSDAANCGLCGQACPSGKACVSGACQS